MVVHFDNAMRLLVERDPARLCAFLLGRTAAELAGTTRLEAELSARPVRADSVLSLPGPPHLVHIEFQLHTLARNASSGASCATGNGSKPNTP